MGRFGRPRSVSGEIYITPATDDPARFLDLTEIFIVSGTARKRILIEDVKLIGGRPVVKLEGIDSREDAAELATQSVEIPIDLARELPEGHYYQFDLVGCRVIGKDNTDYGVLTEVLFYPGGDLYQIESETYGTVLLPAVDRFIISIDIGKKEIIIDPPDGLFESDARRPE